MPSLNELLKNELQIDGVNIFSTPSDEGFDQAKIEAAKKSLLQFCEEENFTGNITFLFVIHDLYLNLESLQSDNTALKERLTKIEQDHLIDAAPHKINVQTENHPTFSDEANVEVLAKAVDEILTSLKNTILPKYVAAQQPAEDISSDAAKEKLKKSLSGIADNTKDIAKTTAALVGTLSKSPEVNKAKEKLEATFKSGLSTLKGFMEKKAPAKTEAAAPKEEEKKDPDNSESSKK